MKDEVSEYILKQPLGENTATVSGYCCEQPLYRYVDRLQTWYCYSRIAVPSTSHSGERYLVLVGLHIVDKALLDRVIQDCGERAYVRASGRLKYVITRPTDGRRNVLELPNISCDHVEILEPVPAHPMPLPERVPATWVLDGLEPPAVRPAENAPVDGPAGEANAPGQSQGQEPRTQQGQEPETITIAGRVLRVMRP